MSSSVLALRTVRCCPTECAADWVSLVSDAAQGSFGLTSIATTSALGTSSRNNPSCFVPKPASRVFTPVMFPPGRLRLVTRPKRTGSSPTLNTMGMLAVAALAAKATPSPPPVTMTATCRVTKSSARAGSRSYRPYAKRNSITTFWSVTYPVSFRPRRNAASIGTSLSADLALKYPITGIGACCARGASGHATTPLPSATINSRRRMWIAVPPSQWGHATERTISHLDVLRCGISNRPMSVAGHSRRTASLQGFVACPLPSVCDGIAASQKSAAWCHNRTHAVQQNS
jgi:hypothetical protein